MQQTPLCADLGGGLVMRTVSSDADIVRVADSHREAFPDEKEIYVFTLDTLRRFPGVRWEDIFYVEDTANGQVASSICLLPTRWGYEDVELDVGELGIVGTRPEYRNRGLIRAQMEIFEQRLQERPYDLGVIQGIPYFYRQFGYEYAVPLYALETLLLEQIPDLKEGETDAFVIRPITDQDVPQALAFAQASSSSLCLHIVPRVEEWLYQENLPEDHPEYIRSYIVQAAGKAIGYFRLRRQKEGMIFCRQISNMPYQATLSAFRFMKREAQEQGANRVSVQGPSSSYGIQVARYLGSQSNKPYAWQIRIPNLARFLQRIAPVLERRLAGSMMAGLTEKVCLNFYRETVDVSFEKGRIVNVASTGKTDERTIRIPPEIAVRLLTCYHSLAEIRDYRPDIGGRAEGRALIDILFPKRESYIYAAI